VIHLAQKYEKNTSTNFLQIFTPIWYCTPNRNYIKKTYERWFGYF
jgi:hypothetical protein